MAEPLERTPLPLAKLGRAAVEELVGATHIVGHHLGRGQSDRLVVRSLIRNAECKLLLVQGVLVFGESLVGLVLLPRDLHVLEAERDHKRDDCQGADGDERSGRLTSPGPLDQSLDGAGSPRPDRLAGQPALEVVGQRLGRAITPLGLFCQALEADRFQVAVDPRIERTGTLRLLLYDLEQGVERRVGAERRPAGQQFVEDRSQAVDVDRPCSVPCLPDACSGAM